MEPVHFIVGANGALGSSMVALLGESGAKVIAASRQPGADNYLDLTDDPSRWILPPADIAYLFAGITSQSLCRERPVESAKINVNRMGVLAERLAEQETHLVYVSTNLVFDGQRPWMSMDAPTRPGTEYGKQKAALEEKLRSISGCSILRVSKIVECIPVVDQWSKDLISGKPVQPLSNAFLAPVPKVMVIDALRFLAENRKAGTFHLSAQYDVTYADFARELASALGVSSQLVKPVTTSGVNWSGDPLPFHTTLDCESLTEAVGISPPDPFDVIREYLGRKIATNSGLESCAGKNTFIPVRTDPMPRRQALGPDEERMLISAINYFRKNGKDPSYRGPFQERYEFLFSEFMGGGHTVAVASGTGALYVAIAALDLPPKSEIVVSPITDPGTVSAIILNGHRVALIDSAPGSYNVGAEQFRAALSPETKAAVIVHTAGDPCDMCAIMEIAREKGVLIVEDCSQAHGAETGDQKVGTFGDIAAFSTMNRKAHIMGGSGGVVYSRDQDRYRLLRAHADRGKPIWRDDFDDRDPRSSLFAALNFNTSDLNCAIGIASLSRLPETIERRREFVSILRETLEKSLDICIAYPMTKQASPFFLPVQVDVKAIDCSKVDFAKAVLEQGIDLNPHYGFLVCDWPWIREHQSGNQETPNARKVIDSSFNLYLNEHYGAKEAQDISAAIKLVEERWECPGLC